MKLTQTTIPLYVNTMKPLISLALLFVLSTACEHQPDLSEFEYWTGTWKCTIPDGSIQYEIWEHKEPNVLHGINFSVKDLDTVQNEQMALVVRENYIAYDVLPEGIPERMMKEFRLLRKNKNMALFENTENDFPQQIIYKRTGSSFLEVSLTGENHAPVILEFVKM